MPLAVGCSPRAMLPVDRSGLFVSLVAAAAVWRQAVESGQCGAVLGVWGGGFLCTQQGGVVALTRGMR